MSGIESARLSIAESINAAPEEIVFTSGGTESNALALEGFCLANRDRGYHVVVSAIEHPSVMEVAKSLQTKGFRLSLLPVDEEGRVSADSLVNALTDKTILVSVMHANNEVGTIQDLESLSAVCRDRGIAFHTDATQSFTKVPIDVRAKDIDLLTMSAHKIHGPKGIGALYVKKGVRLEALLKGGGQESGLRAGTLNTESIIGFGTAVSLASLEDAKKMSELRDTLIDRLTSEVPGISLNGPRLNRLCNNINLTVDGVSSKALLFELDRKGIAVSVGSACASGKKTPSPVLLAMGRSKHAAEESLRVSLSKWTTSAELEQFAMALTEIVAKQRLNGVEHKAG